MVWKQALEFGLGRRAATVKPELFVAFLRSHLTTKGKLPLANLEKIIACNRLPDYPRIQAAFSIDYRHVTHSSKRIFPWRATQYSFREESV